VDVGDRGHRNVGVVGWGLRVDNASRGVSRGGRTFKERRTFRSMGVVFMVTESLVIQGKLRNSDREIQIDRLEISFGDDRPCKVTKDGHL